VARVASHRHLLPETLATKVRREDSEGTVDALGAALENNFDVDAARDFIAGKYSYDQMLAGYEDAMTGISIMPPLEEDYASGLSGGEVLKLPTWCDYRDGRCYNDYHYGYDDDPNLLSLLGRNVLPLRVSEIVERGVSLTTLERLLRSGSLTRVYVAP
jgi:hypothetical protein